MDAQLATRNGDALSDKWQQKQNEFFFMKETKWVSQNTMLTRKEKVKSKLGNPSELKTKNWLLSPHVNAIVHLLSGFATADAGCLGCSFCVSFSIFLWGLSSWMQSLSLPTPIIWCYVHRSFLTCIQVKIAIRKSLLSVFISLWVLILELWWQAEIGSSF